MYWETVHIIHFYFFCVQYGVVLDAGSTHTNMFVYKWKVSDIIKGTALVKQIGQCVVTDKGKSWLWLATSIKLLTEPHKLICTYQLFLSQMHKIFSILPGFLKIFLQIISEHYQRCSDNLRTHLLEITKDVPTTSKCCQRQAQVSVHCPFPQCQMHWGLKYVTMVIFWWGLVLPKMNWMGLWKTRNPKSGIGTRIRNQNPEPESESESGIWNLNQNLESREPERQ